MFTIRKRDAISHSYYPPSDIGAYLSFLTHYFSVLYGLVCDEGVLLEEYEHQIPSFRALSELRKCIAFEEQCQVSTCNGSIEVLMHLLNNFEDNECVSSQFKESTEFCAVAAGICFDT